MPPIISSDNEAARVRAVYDVRARGLRKNIYSYFDDGHLFLLQQRERKVLKLLDRYSLTPLKEKSILEVGCGNGFWLREFVKVGCQAYRSDRNRPALGTRGRGAQSLSAGSRSQLR